MIHEEKIMEKFGFYSTWPEFCNPPNYYFYKMNKEDLDKNNCVLMTADNCFWKVLNLVTIIKDGVKVFHGKLNTHEEQENKIKEYFDYETKRINTRDTRNTRTV